MNVGTILGMVIGTAVAVAMPLNPRPTVPIVETGRISGVVLDASASAQPVHRAVVTLTGTGLPTGRAVVSDDQGRFSFDRLPDGRFTLTAAKPAYLTTAYGAITPGGTGASIALATGQVLPDLQLTMPRGGVIAGTVRNRRGEPVPGLRVSVLRADSSNASPRTRDLRTDDQGHYRAFGLFPGDYLVSAASPSSGGIGEVGQMSTTEVDAVLALLKQGRRTRATGNADAMSLSSVSAPTRSFSAAPIYYPGTTDPERAAPIPLGLSEEQTGIDFVFELGRAATISGSYFGAAPDAKVAIALVPAGAGPAQARTVGSGPIKQRDVAPGTFTFTNVTPGRYVVTARAGATAAELMFTSTTITVTGDDISGVMLALAPTASISGRVEFRSASRPPPDPSGRITIQLSAPGSLPDAGLLLLGVVRPSAAAATVQADGTFVIGGVIPGSHWLTTSGEPGGWRPASAKLGDRELLDFPLDVGTTDIGGIVVTFSDLHTRVTGRLQRPDGTPVSRYFVIAFPAERILWTPESRRLMSARPDTDGHFVFDDLPAGDYYLAAVTDADQDTWRDATFLAEVVPAGVRCSVRDGESRNQDLTIRR